MRKALLASAVSLLAASSPAIADGTEDAGHGWYVGGSVGVNWLQDTNASTFFGNSVDAGFDTGWALMANAGYRCLGGFRGELEIGYRDNNVGSLFVNPVHETHIGGDVTQFSVMANAAYDWHFAPRFALSVGGGIGVVESDFDASGSGFRIVRDAEDDWSFAWQLMGGLAYTVTANTDAFVEYRYFADQSHDVITFPNGFPWRDSVDLDSNTVTVGFRYALGN